MLAEEPGRPISDAESEDLVRGLDNLCWNLHVQAEIFGLGRRAVPALVRFLHGPPSQFSYGRVLAAEALGRLGGEEPFRGLVAVLNPHRLQGLDPVLRFSEETVQNAAARQLARIGDRRAVPALLDAMRVHRLLGAAEALLEFREEAALPWLVEGLEDAFKRDRFAQVIREFGLPAVPHLAETLNRRRMRGEEEGLTSRERRAEALKLLGLLQAREALTAIRAALQDPFDAVRTEAAIALALLGDRDSLEEAGPALIAGLTHPDFLQRDRCAEALTRLGPGCVPVLEQALAEGGVMVGAEAVPLTINARRDALAVLEALRDAERGTAHQAPDRHEPDRGKDAGHRGSAGAP